VAEDADFGREAPPAPAESIHLPGATYIPVLVAAGITLTVVGVVISPYMAAAGLLLFLLPTIRWIRDVREDMAELPLEHPEP